MRAIWSIAATTFRESIRNRTMLGIVLLALAFLGSALLLAALSLDQRIRVITDWGLFCVSAFGVLLAILMGVSQIHQENKRKSIYVVLTRPNPRWKYVLGRQLGLTITLLTGVTCIAGALILLLLSEGVPPSALLFKALWLALVEVLVVAGLALFFASFSSPVLSGMFTFGVFVVGRSMPWLETLSGKTEALLPKGLLVALTYGLPDLASLNVGARVVHGIELPWEQVLTLSLYGFSYLGALIFFSAWIFSRRDLT